MLPGQSRYALVFVAAIVVGTSYMLVRPLGVTGVPHVVWKGAGVSLLAIWAALNARTADGWLTAAVLAFGALGDVLLDAVGLRPGAAAFMFGHVLGVVLYLRNARPKTSPTQVAAAVALFVGTPLIAYLLPADRGLALPFALYGLALGAMVSAAWVSRFPRYRVGIGAVLFVLSDFLIFAEVGPLANSALPHLLIWPLYFGGQALIAWGVVNTLALSGAQPVPAAS